MSLAMMATTFWLTCVAGMIVLLALGARVR